MGQAAVLERTAPTSSDRKRGAEWSGARIAAILLIAAATKLAISWVTPLTSDECFHWLQGRHLAWGYSDHPPGTAVLGRLTTEWLGDTWFGLRLAPIVGSLACSLIAFALLREVGADRRRAAMAAACVQLLPMVGIGMLMVPAVPHTALVFAAQYFLLRALRRGGVGNHVAWGALLGAGFLTYYLTAAAALAGAVFVALDPRGRASLRDWRLWLGGAVAAAVFVPNIAWNLGRGEESAAHFQLLERNDAGFHPEYLAAFALLALVVAGPLLLPALRQGWPIVRNLRTAAPDANARDADWRPYFATFLLVVLTLFALFAVTTKVGAHWAVLAYLNVPLLLLAPGAAPLRSGWWRSALVYGALIAAGVFGAAAIGMERAVALLPGNEGRPAISRARFLHFDDVAAIAHRAVDDARGEGSVVLLAADRWSHASLLAFHGSARDVAVYPPAERHGRDFRTWSHDVVGPVELIYVTTRPTVDADVRAASRSVTQIAAVERDGLTFAWIHRCSGFAPPPEWR